MSQRRLASYRWFCSLSLVALLAGAAAYLPGRDDEKPPEKKPGDKGMCVEEEDSSFKPGKPVLRVEEPDVIDKTTKMFPRPTADLKQATGATKSGFLRKVYRDLEVPHEVVFFPGGDRKENIQPLNVYVGGVPQNIKGMVELIPLDAEWKPGKPRSVGPAGVEKVRHYEQLVRDAVVEALANDKDLLKHERLAAAEQLLTVALTFHETARRGDEWKLIGDDLRKELFNVLITQVQETGEAKDWGEAADLSKRLAATYTTEAEQVRLAGVLGDLLLKALNEPAVKTARLREVRQQVRRIVDQYSTNPALQGLNANLRQQAGHLLAAAKKALDDKQIPRAEEFLQAATELDPQSQGLREYRTKLHEFYPVLRVAVRELPKFFSPARAITDTELRSVELLFEGLVKVVPGPDGSPRYRPGLAESRPRIVPLGREFLLPRNAFWPSQRAGQPDKPVTAADVSYSVTKLKEGLGGRPKAWGELLKDVEIGDPTHVTLTLTRGHLEPLALMTFKIIPEGAKADDEDFATKNPLGSGPYRLGERGKDAQGDYVSFVSNPTYGSRLGRSGLPHIREIRLYVVKDAVKELKEQRIDLALDLTASQAADLAKDAKFLVPSPAPNRRIYFLAVNHQPGSPLANASLRRGLALSINREELLDEYFRKGLGKSVHRALNGPFPTGSWAGKPTTGNKSADPFDAKLAETRINEGWDAVRAPKLELTLKYPNDDPKVGDALKDLRKQALSVSKDRIDLKLTPLSPYELRKAIDEKNYQLAYCHYDFPDETYWLGPLLGQDGNNMLSYRGGDLQNLIREAAARREFDKVHERVKIMHGVLDADMPLIPLWQLDPLAAYRAELKPVFYDRSTMGPRKEVEKVPFDPQLVFTDVENWRLERQ